MSYFGYLLVGGPFGVLTLRSFLFWLRTWQQREYRWDRLRAYLGTQEGLRALLVPGGFAGILPRPKLTGRMVLTAGAAVTLCCGVFFFVAAYGLAFTDYRYILAFLLLERTMILWTALGVAASYLPARWKKQKLFHESLTIIEANPDIKRIGVTGSFGKSSTKEILAHLLRHHFGAEHVLVSPANENTEVALARLVMKNRAFFSAQNSAPRIALLESGAYRVGEIAQVADFFRPHISVVTGINAQHLSLFGSKENIITAETEMAYAATDTIFYNGDSSDLTEKFAAQTPKATPLPVKQEDADIGEIKPGSTTFTWKGATFTLPWGGDLYVRNALLALSVMEHLGVSPQECAQALTTMPPLPRALHVTRHAQGYSVLWDLYSANPDGVLGAIRHLGTFAGRKVFVGIPLIELGAQAEGVHRTIFKALKNMDAQVYWLKDDFASIGREVLGDAFRGKDTAQLARTIATLEEEDAVLLESRLPEAVTALFSHEKDRQ